MEHPRYIPYQKIDYIIIVLEKKTCLMAFPASFPRFDTDSTPHLSPKNPQAVPRRMVLGRIDSCAGCRDRRDSAELGCSGEALDSGAGG